MKDVLEGVFICLSVVLGIVIMSYTLVSAEEGDKSALITLGLEAGMALCIATAWVLR